MKMTLPLVECDDYAPTPHVCIIAGYDILAHSPMDEPFANGETEIFVTDQFDYTPGIGDEVEVELP